MFITSDVSARRYGKVKALSHYSMAKEPSTKCHNCGKLTMAFVLVDVEPRWSHPQDIGTGNDQIGHHKEQWCLDCLRGKNDKPWVNAKPWEKPNCISCGKPIQFGVSFCQSCGKPQ